MDQLHYTSSERNLNGKTGFGVRARTPSMPPADIERIASYAGYDRPREEGAAPASLSFFRLDEEVWCLSKTQYVGTDNSGTREGNFFFHAVRLTASDLDRIGDMPIRCRESRVWQSSPSDQNGDLPPLAGLQLSQGPDAQAVEEFLQDAGRRERFSDMLHALATLATTNRRLVLIDRPEHVVRWIEALTLALPARIRRDFTFSTYQHSLSLNFALTATRLDAGFAVDSHMNGQAYWIFDFEKERFSPSEPLCEAARFLSDRLCDGDAEEMGVLGRMAADLGMDRLSDLAPLVALRRVVYTSSFPQNEDEIDQVEATLRSARTSRTLAGRVAAEMSVGAMAGGADLFLTRMLQIAFQDSLPKDAASLAGRCAASLRSSLQTRGAWSRIALFGGIAKRFPPLLKALLEGIGPEDWAAFLALASTTDKDVEFAMPLLRPSALQGGAMAAWRALCGWSSRHGNGVFQDELERLLDRRDNASRAIGRLCLDGWPSWATNAPPAARVSVACRLLAAAKEGEAWEDDAIRVSDQALDAGDASGQARIAKAIVEGLANRPEVLSFVLEEVLALEPAYAIAIVEAFAARPDYVDWIVGLFASGRLPEIVEQAVENPGPHLDNLLVAASKAPSSRRVDSLIRRLVDQYLRSPRHLGTIQDLLGKMPQLRQDKAIQGDLLLRAFATGPDIKLLPGPHFLPWVSESLFAQRFPLSPDEQTNAELSLQVSRVSFELRGIGPSGERCSVGQVADLVSLEARKVSRKTYISYLDSLFSTVPGTSRIEPLGTEMFEFVRRIILDEWFDVFAERYALLLEAVYPKPGYRAHAILPILVHYLPFFIAARARHGAVKRLVQLTSKADCEAIVRRMEGIQGFEAYWEGVEALGLKWKWGL